MTKAADISLASGCRSYLFVPGDNLRMLEKALQSGADALIVDLEDSVSLTNKGLARTTTAKFIVAQANDNSGIKLFVRINAFDTPYAEDDLTVLLAAKPQGIMLPKAQGQADIEKLNTLIAQAELQHQFKRQSIAIMPLVAETAQSIFSLGDYARCAERLSAITWGAEDLLANLGATANRDDSGQLSELFRMVRGMTLMAAIAANADPIDTVYPAFRDAEGFERDCVEARGDGFTGKLAIHPAQIAIINRIFSPTEAEIEQAQTIVNLLGDAKSGVCSLDGKMLDNAHLLKARRLLARVKA